MGKHNHAPLPIEFGEVHTRIQSWRASKNPGSAMPAELWKEAASWTAGYGIHRVCKALGLSQSRMNQFLEPRRPMELRQVPTPVRPTFVELPVAKVLDTFNWLGLPDLTDIALGDEFKAQSVPRVKATGKRTMHVPGLNFWAMLDAILEAKRLRGVHECPVVALSIRALVLSPLSMGRALIKQVGSLESLVSVQPVPENVRVESQVAAQPAPENVRVESQVSAQSAPENVRVESQVSSILAPVTPAMPTSGAARARSPISSLSRKSPIESCNP